MQRETAQPDISSELKVLYDISEFMSVGLNIDELSRQIVEKISFIMNVGNCSLMLLDEAAKELVIKSAKGLSKDIIKNTRLRIGENISGWVVQNKAPLLIEDIDKDERFRVYRKERYMTRSLLSVPLKIKDSVLGVLNVNNKLSGGVFTQDDLKMLTIVALQVAIAIDNARLYEELKFSQEGLAKNHKEMGRLLEDMKKMEKMKDEFISIVSHELRTPLTSIKEAVSLLVDEIPGKINDDQKEFLLLIKHDTERLARLLNDILDISRIEAGKLQMKTEELDIREVIRHCVGSMNPMAGVKGIRLLNEVNHDLSMIDADRIKIEQILTNLLSNAIKFSPNKGEIRVVAKDGDGYITISVIDNGIGIPEKDFEKIFHKFYQSDSSTTRRAEGTGLGLSIVKGLVEVHGGRIWVESKAGEGSAFHFTLPKKR